MKNEQAINILITAARVGQAKGAYTFEEASVINEAIKVFVTPIPPVTVDKKEVKEGDVPFKVEELDK